MRRHAAILLLCGAAAIAPIAPAAFASPLEAQPQAESKPAAQTEGESPKTLILLWINFLILAGYLGYLTKKHGGPFFAARSGRIQKEMAEAGAQRKDAEARAADVDKRLANIEKELADIRAESHREIEAHRQRSAQQTAAEIARVRAQAEQEIASAGKSARFELKRYSAELALALAGEKLRARINPAAEDALVAGFIKTLDRTPPHASAQNN